LARGAVIIAGASLMQKSKRLGVIISELSSLQSKKRLGLVVVIAVRFETGKSKRHLRVA
jgi:hypothetical protein